MCFGRPFMTSEEKKELNEQVARKLGWEYIPELSPVCWTRKNEDRTQGAYLRDVPDYVGDIRAAWEIVEKYICSVSRIHHIPSNMESFYRYRCVIQCDITDFISAEADTASEAIVKAFLKLK